MNYANNYEIIRLIYNNFVEYNQIMFYHIIAIFFYVSQEEEYKVQNLLSA